MFVLDKEKFSLPPTIRVHISVVNNIPLGRGKCIMLYVCVCVCVCVCVRERERERERFIHFFIADDGGKGLGSSGTAVVAGVLLANRLGRLNLDQRQILAYCNQIEGHPDNASASVCGGVIACCSYEEDHHTKAQVLFHMLQGELLFRGAQYSLSLSHTHTHTHTIMRISSHPLAHIYTQHRKPLTHTHNSTNFLSHPLAHIYTHNTANLSLTHAQFHEFPLSSSRSHIHTRYHKPLTHTHTIHTHERTHALSFFFSLFFSLSWPTPLSIHLSLSLSALTVIILGGGGAKSSM